MSHISLTFLMIICRYIPLPKSSRAERIRSNVNVYDFNLSDAEMESLDKLDKGTDGAISWNPINAN